jgi:hypothetical protein
MLPALARPMPTERLSALSLLPVLVCSVDSSKRIMRSRSAADATASKQYGALNGRRLGRFGNHIRRDGFHIGTERASEAMDGPFVLRASNAISFPRGQNSGRNRIGKCGRPARPLTTSNSTRDGACWMEQSYDLWRTRRGIPPNEPHGIS